MAPEIFIENEEDDQNYYTKKVDIWSMGIVLHQMFTCTYPFWSEREIKNDRPFEFNSSVKWDVVSEDAKHMLKKMLEKDPDQRYAIENVRNDVWLAGDPEVNRIVHELIIAGQLANLNDADNDLENIPSPSPSPPASSSSAGSKESSTFLFKMAVSGSNNKQQTENVLRQQNHQQDQQLQLQPKHCFKCTETFMTESLLYSHLEREHGVLASYIEEHSD